MNHAYYHWWDEEGDPEPHQNIRASLLMSIATLRAHNPTIPITVLDGSRCAPLPKKSPRAAEWQYFQEKLNFNVVECKVTFASRYRHRRGHMHLSKLLDLQRETAVYDQTVVYCDSDVFWLSDPLPLSCNPSKFCFDGYNSGFFYFNTRSDVVWDMFEIFQAYVVSCLNNEDVLKLLASQYHYNSWHYLIDEWILAYMAPKHPELFEITPRCDHVCSRDLGSVEPSQIRMFHCNGLMVDNAKPKLENEKHHSRGLLCLIFEELYEAITKVLSSDDLQMMFTPDQLDYYLANQFSLRKNTGLISASKSPDGHYHIAKCLKVNRKPLL